MSLPGFDDWLTNQDRYYGPTDDDYQRWNEENDYRDEVPDEVGTNEDPEYYPVLLSCGHEVWGTDADIDSGIRKHLEYCPNAQTDEDEG